MPKDIKGWRIIENDVQVKADLTEGEMRGGNQGQGDRGEEDGGREGELLSGTALD